MVFLQQFAKVWRNYEQIGFTKQKLNFKLFTLESDVFVTELEWVKFDCIAAFEVML